MDRFGKVRWCLFDIRRELDHGRKFYIQIVPASPSLWVAVRIMELVLGGQAGDRMKEGSRHSHDLPRDRFSKRDW